LLKPVRFSQVLQTFDERDRFFSFDPEGLSNMRNLGENMAVQYSASEIAG